MNRIDTNEFIKRAKAKFGDKFDYSKVEYKNNTTKVCIICPDHGEFWITPISFLATKYGCPECSGLKKWDTEKFIEKAKDIHGNKYDYTHTVYVNKRTPVEIICPIHGPFIQNPHNHISQKQGCPICGKKYAKEWRKCDWESFVDESRKRFGEIYEFPDIDKLYENSHSKILIKCKKCGNVFEKIACDHLTSSHGGCLHCYANKSKGEEEICDFVKQALGENNVSVRNRSVLKNSEIDLYVPNKKIGIEYNGVYWHSEPMKGKNYHLYKTEECKNSGIGLVQIFEDEYLYHRDIVLTKLLHILGADTGKEKVYARKCEAKEIRFQEAKEFLTKNHIQGFARSTVYLGLFNSGELVSVMTFIKRGNQWELNRFASDNSKTVLGAGGKLFQFFVRKYDPEEVKSFADRRWTINETKNLYTLLGFTFEKYTKPDYRYITSDSGVERKHKFNFRKKILSRKYGLPLTMSETEMCQKIGAIRVYDCGLIKYVWKKKTAA